MKNLANCGIREFMKQTAKIRHAVENWLKLTDIMNIRKRLPDIPDDISAEEKQQRLYDHARENLSMILDEIMDKHPDETVDLLAMLCFVEPEHADDHPTKEYLASIAEMIEDEDVMRFFTSLMNVGRRLGLMG